MAVSTTEQVGTWDGQELSATCFIDGAWVDGDADGTDVLDPATERSLARVRFASTAQVVENGRRRYPAGL